MELLQNSDIKIETLDKVPGNMVPEIIRLYDMGFCNCEPYWETCAKISIDKELEEITYDKGVKLSYIANNNRLVGFILVSSVNPSRFVQNSQLAKYVEGDFYILELVVDKEFRKKGIGALLIQRMIDLATEQKSKGLTLRADLRNKTALKLYQGLGFNLLQESLTENPFDVYIRKDLVLPKVEMINTEDVKRLFSKYKPEKNIFFSNQDEIDGWRLTTKSPLNPTKLCYTNEGWVSENYEDFSKQVWFIPRQ